MQMMKEQFDAYEKEGIVFLPNCFSQDEVDAMKAELPPLFAEDTPRRVIEKEGGMVRSVYGSHMTNEVFRRLVHHPRLVEPARRILDSEVYVYQFKINAKAAFGGDMWDWHQDYVFWRKEDGMPQARVLNVAIFLDDVTEFNGPMFFIPGSHKIGVIDVPARDHIFGNGGDKGAYQNSPAWISNLTASIKYSVDKEMVAKMVEERGIVAPKGERGSAIFFHGNIIHASPNNISPHDRGVIFVTYNSLENIPVEVERPRPDFLSSRDYQPVVSLSDDTLLRERLAVKHDG
jgi:Phytanoyl-CoA dioxygenase (PhyH)